MRKWLENFGEGVRRKAFKGRTNKITKLYLIPTLLGNKDTEKGTLRRYMKSI